MGRNNRLPIRLALRAEGSFWNAYLASKNTMEGAHLIGSIMLRPCQDNPELKARFQSLMTDVMSFAIKEQFGAEPDWVEERPAPTIERGGNA